MKLRASAGIVRIAIASLREADKEVPWTFAQCR